MAYNCLNLLNKLATQHVQGQKAMTVNTSMKESIKTIRGSAAVSKNDRHCRVSYLLTNYYFYTTFAV